MASLKDARGLAEELHAQSGRLQAELEKGSADFGRLVELTDEIGESADRLAMTFDAINGSLTGLVERREPDDGGKSKSRGEGGTLDEALAPSRSRGERSKSRQGGARRKERQQKKED